MNSRWVHRNRTRIFSDETKVKVQPLDEDAGVDDRNVNIRPFDAHDNQMRIFSVEQPNENILRRKAYR